MSNEIKERKYEFTGDTKKVDGRKLRRIRAVRAFRGMHERARGGWIESEKNLSHEGNAWVGGNAMVYGDAVVRGDAIVSGQAIVRGFATIRGCAEVHGTAIVEGSGEVRGESEIYDHAKISGYAFIDGAKIFGHAIVHNTDISAIGAKIAGRAVINREDHYVYAGSVGSSRAVLAAYLTDTGEIHVTRGCFEGTLKEFIKAVKYTHRNNRPIRKEYLLLAKFIKSRLGPAAKKRRKEIENG